MNKRLLAALILCALIVPAVIMTTQASRATKPSPANPAAAQPTGATAQVDHPADPQAPRKSRPGITELLPPGYQLTEAGHGGNYLTIPGNKGVYATGSVTIADRGLVFKGPIAFALSKDGPWIGYAAENTAMHLAKDGTIKLSGESAIVREDTPPPAEAESKGQQE